MFSSSISLRSPSKEDNEDRYGYLLPLPNYGKEVLLGNWYNRRVTSDITRNNAILPGLTAEDACEKHKTLYQQEYTMKPFKADEALQAHLELHNDVITNTHVYKNSRVHLCDHARFCNNYTTTNTLLYSMLPSMRLTRCLDAVKDVTPRQQDYYAAHTKLQLDTLEAYGNHTAVSYENKHNKDEIKDKAKKCAEKKAYLDTTYITSYRDDFRLPPASAYGTEDEEAAEELDEDTEEPILLNCNLHDDLKQMKI